MRFTIGLLTLFIICQSHLYCKDHRDGYLFIFWNLENFFDTRYHKGKERGDFTPYGEMRWGRKKFTAKRDAIAKTLIDAGGGELPVFAGFAEVENRYVLKQLIDNTLLSFGGYEIIHKDSPDTRGIDVALIYRREFFHPLYAGFICVALPDTSGKTRDILYTSGILAQKDTIHILINHWPSKFGGERASRPKRMAAALALKLVCDSILDRNEKANIIVAGDFNDHPASETVLMLNRLKNLSDSLFARGEGTIKYRGVWHLIDQIMVSPNLTDKTGTLVTGVSFFEIFSRDYLLERDKAFTGTKPRRTYIGPRYNGGISDHLPVRMLITTGLQKE